ncbi:MAG: ATP-binding protein [Bacillota bacterium]
MATRTVLFKEALRELDKIRTMNENEWHERKERIFVKLPRLREIESELSKTATTSMRLIVEQNLTPEEVVERLRSDQARLLQERDAILEENKFPTTVLDLQYSCEKCDDTGYIGQERCICLQQKIMDKIYDQSNIKQQIRTDNFLNFRFDVYGDIVPVMYDKSPRENAKSIFRECMDFIEKFPTGKNLFMTGTPGLGKTFLSNCIASELLEKGFVVLYFSSGQLFQKLEAQRFHNNSETAEEFKEWDNDLLEADLLIIDDLGAEFPTVYTKSQLFRIINDRHLAGKSIIISTNLSVEEIQGVYFDRITSRIVGEFAIMEFYGDDIRFLKRLEE